MGMIIKVYVEYDNQEVNITTLNADNSKTSTVTITSKFVEEYLRTTGAKEYEKNDEHDDDTDDTEIVEKDSEKIDNAEVTEDGLSPVSETDFSQYTVLDSTCDDELNESLIGVPPPYSTQIERIESSSNRIVDSHINSGQDADVAIASSIIDDENDTIDRPKNIVETGNVSVNGKDSSACTQTDIEKTVTTDMVKDMNALQNMTYEVDDFLTSVAGETKSGEISPTLRVISENFIEKFDDDVAVADMSRNDIVMDYDPNLKEYFIVDEILASRFNEETQSTEYLLKPRKCVPRDDKWRPLSNLEKPNGLSITEPERLYIQCPKTHSHKILKAKKISDNEKSSNTNKDLKVSSSVKPLNTSHDRLKKTNQEKSSRSRTIRSRTKKTLPTPAVVKSPAPLSETPTVLNSSSTSPAVKESPCKRTKVSETQSPFTNWLQCSICRWQCLSLAGLLDHKKTHSRKRLAVKRKLQNKSPVEEQLSEQSCDENATLPVSNSKLSHTLPVQIPLDKIEDTKSLFMNSKLERRNGVKIDDNDQLSSPRITSITPKKLSSQGTKKMGDKSENSWSRKSTGKGKGQKKAISREFIDNGSDSESDSSLQVAKKEDKLGDTSKLDKISTLMNDSSKHTTSVNDGKRPQTARRSKKFDQQGKNSDNIKPVTTNGLETSKCLPMAQQSKRSKQKTCRENRNSSKSSSQTLDAKMASSESDENEDKYASQSCSFTTSGKHRLNTHEYEPKEGETYPSKVSTDLRQNETEHHDQSSNDRSNIRSSKYPIVLVKKWISL